MIVSSLHNSWRVEELHPAFKRLFDFVKKNDLLNMPLGQIKIDGDNLFINNVNPACVTQEEQVLEMHRDYIDVHILLEGEETIGWKAIEDIMHISKEYDKEGDYALSDDAPTAFVTLAPGQVCIVWPEDPHAPVIGKGKIRKLIGKVKI